MGNSSDIRHQKEINDKVLSVLNSICSISIIILVCMQILGIWKTTINVVEALLGVLMLIHAIQKWKKNRVVAIMSLFAAMLIFSNLIFLFVTR